MKIIISMPKESLIITQKYKNFILPVSQNLPKIVKEISIFLGISIGDEDIQDICKKSSFSEMKKDTEKENSDPSHTVCALTSNRKLIFRKGKFIVLT